MVEVDLAKNCPILLPYDQKKCSDLGPDDDPQVGMQLMVRVGREPRPGL